MMLLVGYFMNEKDFQLLQISLKVRTRDYLYNVRKAVKLFERL